MMVFPAPAPAYPEDQGTVSQGHLRYEDLAQDGRLMPLALPPQMGGLWRGLLSRHPGARSAQQSGIVPLLTRLTLSTTPQHIRLDRPVEARGGYQLAHDRDAAGEVTRVFLNIWCDVFGATGRLFPPEPAGDLALAGRMFAEHTFTRPFAPPDQRRVTRLAVEGFPDVPEARYPSPHPATAATAPDGARWLDELAPDEAESCFTLDQTDSNQHVNSLVYVRCFLDATQRRFAAAGVPLRRRSRGVDIAYRKPCFAGDRIRAHLRLFQLGEVVGAAGFMAGAGEEARPRCYVRVVFDT
ncbi:MAG: hypothetical protein H0T79_10995 [Deltaproteobacteria bacterium]|nr:hypothetical protein [Deltaproteobacteria bacterium]